MIEETRDKLFPVVAIRNMAFSLSPHLPIARSIELIEAFLTVLDAGLTGDVAEFGIADGFTLKAMAVHLERIGSLKMVWGFDWFQGLPAATEEDLWKKPDAALNHGMMGWYKASVQQVEGLLCDLDNYRLVEGLIQDTGPLFAHPLCFAHINTDLYAGCHASLQVLQREMIVGGKAVISGYHTQWDGLTKAVDDFLESNANWSKEGEDWLTVLTRES
jgi:hypothetical protein